MDLGNSQNGFHAYDPEAERALEAWAMAGPKFPRPRPARSAGLEAQERLEVAA